MRVCHKSMTHPLHLSSRSSPLREEEGNRPTRCSEPLRSKVGGPSKVCAKLCGLGPPGVGILNCFVLLIKYSGSSRIGWLYRSREAQAAACLLIERGTED